MRGIQGSSLEPKDKSSPWPVEGTGRDGKDTRDLTAALSSLSPQAAWFLSPPPSGPSPSFSPRTHTQQTANGCLPFL